MMELIRISGPTGTIHVILAVVIAVIAVRRVMQLAGGSFVAGPEWDAAVNGILFWGGFAAVLGLLGQTVGIYIALTAIRAASDVAPWIVVEGFMVWFTNAFNFCARYCFFNFLGLLIHLASNYRTRSSTNGCANNCAQTGIP